MLCMYNRTQRAVLKLVLLVAVAALVLVRLMK